MTPIKLSKEQVELLKRSQRELIEILPEFDRLEQCGVDCQGLRDINKEALDRTSKMLELYSK